jgi:chemotaxis protein MotB
MYTVKSMFVMLMCTMFLGCVSQQAHERAIEELKMTSQGSSQEISQLQKEKQAFEEALSAKDTTVVQLKKEKQAFEETLSAKDATVVQLQEANEDLEAAIEVQEQIKEKNLEALKKELQALYSQVAGLGKLSGATPANFSVGMDDDGVDFDDLAKAFRNVRSTLASQMSDFSQLRAQNGQLEEELQQLEARLRHVERLKEELEQVRAAREAQEAKLAKVRREVRTVGKEIDRITKALEEKFGKSLVVTQHQDRLVLTMLGQVLFESGKAQLTPLGLDIMKQVGEVLATLPNKNIQVEGHTDNNPIYGRLQQQYPTNWELSTARATTVLRFLIEQTGMNPKDFSATGYADTRPAVANDSEEGRAQNRRVEIVLYPEHVLQDNNTVATLTQ